MIPGHKPNLNLRSSNNLNPVNYEDFEVAAEADSIKADGFVVEQRGEHRTPPPVPETFIAIEMEEDALSLCLRFTVTAVVLEVILESMESNRGFAMGDTRGEVSIELRIAEGLTAGVILELNDAMMVVTAVKMGK